MDVSNPKKILTQLRSEYRKLGNSVKAQQMRAYMKSEMPYHGVQTPKSQKLLKLFFKDLQFKNKREWENLVLYIWRNAKFREERYAALFLCGHKSARDFETPASIKMYEEIIVDGAWWDVVDTTSHFVGNILIKHPIPMKSLMRKWSRSSNLWKRRVSIISQLQCKKDTDLKLLYDCIEPSLGSKEFFLQKAIGWALRQYAWTNPHEIERYVNEHRSRLAKLSQREALKNL